MKEKVLNDSFILVTGGAGYIGSHLTRHLYANGYRPIVVDDLSTGDRMRLPANTIFVKADIRDRSSMRKLLRSYRCGAVMHLAGSSIVSKSFGDPAAYYHNNVGGTITLLELMREFSIKRLIFASTAAVYQEPKRLPVRENVSPLPQNPYGASKLMAERIIQDYASAYDINYVIMRYFNVAGWETGLFPKLKRRKMLTLLMSSMMNAVHQGEAMHIYGRDHGTRDGTGLRDYIFVGCLCRAHLRALAMLCSGKIKGATLNLGSGQGRTVLEIVAAAEKVVGRKIPYKFKPKRLQEISRMVADITLIKSLLGWSPEVGLDKIIKSEYVL